MSIDVSGGGSTKRRPRPPPKTLLTPLSNRNKGNLADTPTPVYVQTLW